MLQSKSTSKLLAFCLPAHPSYSQPVPSPDRLKAMAHTPASQAAGERGPLQHDHIVQAVAASNDQGQTLDFSHKNITEIQDDATHELATIGRDDDDDEGCVTRLVMATCSPVNSEMMLSRRLLQNRTGIQLSNDTTAIVRLNYSPTLSKSSFEWIHHLSRCRTLCILGARRIGWLMSLLS